MAQTKSNLPARQSRSADPVHIAPTTMAPGSTSTEIDADRWVARGFDLKTLIAQIYGVDLRQVDLPDASEANARYDVTLLLPDSGEQGPEFTQQLLAQALQAHFKLTITPQRRLTEVYVLTAPNGPGPSLRTHAASASAPASSNPLLKRVSLEESDLPDDDAQQITFVGKDCSGVAAGGIAATAATISEFRRTLEPDLDRLLVDETRLTGSYDFRIGNYRNQKDLFQLLRDQLGLVVLPARRQLIVLTVRPA